MYNKTVLKNGVRIVSEEIPGVRSVAVGFWIGTGSRLEKKEDAGISHMIEHILFKGTKRRTAKQIAESIESLGGQLNAFTSKEYTCYYARVLDEHLPLAVDVLSDMYFSSLFRAEDIEREKKVIQEEIRMYEDTPDEIIHDLFTQTIWDGHPLGRPVIGTMESVSGLTKEKILDFYHKYYNPSNLVLAFAGNLSHEQVLELVEANFSESNSGQLIPAMEPPETKAAFKTFVRPLEQAQMCLGVPAVSQYDEKIYPLQVLNNILGGGASSRLFQKIREERGLVYTVYSYYTTFHDTGLFTIYAGTNPGSISEVLDLIWHEINHIVREGITEEELTRTKEQIKGSLLLASESVVHRMHRLGKSELIHHRLITPEEILQKISLVTPDDVRNLAAELLEPSRFTLVVLGDVEKDGISLPWGRLSANIS
ncbi:MAG TPA: insulinase family protein [Syntrophomonadaceae bacterium]|nr:insulinase family protein [Syntrophomonadaceae bacterium]